MEYLPNRGTETTLRKGVYRRRSSRCSFVQVTVVVRLRVAATVHREIVFGCGHCADSDGSEVQSEISRIKARTISEVTRPGAVRLALCCSVTNSASSSRIVWMGVRGRKIVLEPNRHSTSASESGLLLRRSSTDGETKPCQSLAERRLCGISNAAQSRTCFFALSGVKKVKRAEFQPGCAHRQNRFRHCQSEGFRQVQFPARHNTSESSERRPSSASCR